MKYSELIDNLTTMLKDDAILLYDVAYELNSWCGYGLDEGMVYYDICMLDDFCSTEKKSVLEILDDLSKIDYHDSYFYIDDARNYCSFNDLDNFKEYNARYIEIDEIIDLLKQYACKIEIDNDDFKELAEALCYGDYEDDDEEE